MSHSGSQKKRSSRTSQSKKSRQSSRKPAYRPVPPSGIKQLLTRVWNVIFYVVTIGILVGAVLFKFDNSPTKSFYGYHFMTVKTDSMAKTKKTTFTDGFPAGSFIIVKKVDPLSLSKKWIQQA